MAVASRASILYEMNCDVKHVLLMFQFPFLKVDVASGLTDCRGGIYKYDGKSPTGQGHAVFVVGYNDEDRYWIAKNSCESSMTHL